MELRRHERKGDAEEHTAPFPAELASTCIRAGSPVDGLVLDPFCGRGTALAEALTHGRRALGIEAHDRHATRARELCVEAIERRGEASPAQAELKRRPTQLGLCLSEGRRR